MTELITVDTIINAMKGWVETKHPISPDVFVDAAGKLAILLGDENDKLFFLQQDVAKCKVMFIEGGDSVAKAEVKTEASNLYREMCSQKAKVEQIQEFIRIAKIRARLVSEEYRAQM